jgi:crotonobetainyl-CoA:carnitine CoA-transferase CaiB-like acyl-CoA transferase
MGVGAVATRLLADFGAEVIRIEDRRRLDMPRRLPLYKGEKVRPYGEEDVDPDPNKGGMFNNYNRNKLGITLNMREQKGRDLAEQLIKSSDALTENFAPGVMERWGLTEHHVRSLNPTILYARMSGFGHSGPYAEYRSYGPVVQAVCGLSHISGLPGREPSGWGLSYMDNQAAYYNSMALLAGLLGRRLTGQGTDIDVSAVEAGLELIGPLLLDVAVNKRSTRRDDFPLGNRLDHPAVAPHGVYPCQGTDRWIAIAIFNESEWSALAGVMGSPAWTTDARFSSMADRYQHQDELDALLGEWTRNRDRHELMTVLQDAGVRAGAVQDAQDVNELDPQMAHRDVFFELDHPVIGEARFEGVPFTSSSFAADHWRSAPLLGEDNEYVMTTLLGLSVDKYHALEREGVL